MKIVIDTDLGTLKIDEGDPIEYHAATYTINIPDFVLNILFNKVERVGINRFPPKKRKKRRDAKTPQQMERNRIEMEFCKMTGLEPPTGSGSTNAYKWWNPLKKYLGMSNGDVSLTISRMSKVVADLRRADLTISSPLSIQNNFISLVAKEKSGGGNQVIW